MKKCSPRSVFIVKTELANKCKQILQACDNVLLQGDCMFKVKKLNNKLSALATVAFLQERLLPEELKNLFEYAQIQRELLTVTSLSQIAFFR